MPEIPVPLTVEPKLRCGPQQPCQPKGGIRRNTALAIDDLIDSRIRHVNSHSKLSLSKAERLEKLRAEHLSRVRGWSAGWKRCHWI